MSLGFGLRTTAQVAPVQRSINVFGTDPVVTAPTAKQLVALAHATLDNVLTPAPIGFGLDTTIHCVPFQRSTKVFVVPAGE